MSFPCWLTSGSRSCLNFYPPTLEPPACVQYKYEKCYLHKTCTHTIFIIGENAKNKCIRDALLIHFAIRCGCFFFHIARIPSFKSYINIIWCVCAAAEPYMFIMYRSIILKLKVNIADCVTSHFYPDWFIYLLYGGCVHFVCNCQTGACGHR